MLFPSKEPANTFPWTSPMKMFQNLLSDAVVGCSGKTMQCFQFQKPFLLCQTGIFPLNSFPRILKKNQNQGLVNCCTFVKACPICRLFCIDVCREAEFDLVKNQMDLEDLVSSFESSQLGGPLDSQEGCTMFTFKYRYISFICFFYLPPGGSSVLCIP